MDETTFEEKLAEMQEMYEQFIVCISEALQPLFCAIVLSRWLPWRLSSWLADCWLYHWLLDVERLT